MNNVENGQVHIKNVCDGKTRITGHFNRKPGGVYDVNLAKVQSLSSVMDFRVDLNEQYSRTNDLGDFFQDSLVKVSVLVGTSDNYVLMGTVRV